MPSREPGVWRADVEATRAALPRGKVLSVSVVATPQPGWTLDQLADDYATCARWAAEAGADCVEANLSCPNVHSNDGNVYQRPADAGVVAARLRGAIGRKPLLVKLGHVADSDAATELLEALAPHVDGVVTVNTVRARVAARGGGMMFDGQPRGVAGEAIREAALSQAKLFNRIIRGRGLAMRVVGVGGISTARHVRAFLEAGCDAVQIATAAMLDPAVALRIRGE
jgi:dihydroorotate dehydrogenase